MSIKIPLTKGKFAIVDEADLESISQLNWCVSGRAPYLYATSTTKKNRVYLHRFILNAKNGVVVDHINGDRLDNRRDNLRICTQSQNLCNRTVLQKSNTSGVRGVYWDNRRKKWCAEIKLHRKKHYLGRFSKMVDAIIARTNSEKFYFGEYAPQGGV